MSETHSYVKVHIEYTEQLEILEKLHLQQLK